MKSKKAIVVKNVVFSFIPAFLTYLSKSNNILDDLQAKGYIGTSMDIDDLKDKFLVLSIVLTFILLTYNIIRIEFDKNYYRDQRNKMLGFNKGIFLSALERAAGIKNIDLDIRIFVPKNTLVKKIKMFFNKNEKIEYFIRNIDLLANSGITDNLKFEVYPNPQGLVGESYNKRSMIYDPDLENTNSTSYNLTNYQINKTHDLRFCLCCPIFNSNGEIISVMSFDSKREISINRENETVFKSSFTTFTQSLFEYVPDIFKPKGGIL